MVSLLSANLQAFKAVVDSGTVHGAAKILFITQTGITQRIKTLESELGATLFLRSRKGMQLTSEGEALNRYCLNAIALEGQVLNELLHSGKKATVAVTIAGPTSIINSRIASLCIPLYKSWPMLNLNLNITDDLDRIAFVKAGKADFAIVSPELVPNEMTSKLLKPEKYILVGAINWKHRQIKEILEEERAVDFDENDSTTLNYLTHFSLTQFLKRPRIFSNSNESLTRLLAAAVGFGTLTEEIAKPFLEQEILTVLNEGRFVKVPLALAWYPRLEMPKYFKAIISSIH